MIDNSVEFSNPDDDRAEKGKILKRLIESAKKSRSDWLEVGKEIAQYAYSKDHDFQYSDFKGDLFFKATVGKTAEYIETVGPALYQQNPDRRVKTAEWALPEAHMRNEIVQNLLNYTPSECDLSNHTRRVVDDAITFGVGVAWTGWNPRKRVVQTVYDSVENLILDPDAKYMEELNWGGRKRVKPKWWLLDRFQGDADATNALAEIKSDDSTDSGSKSVTFYEMYFRVGLHHFKNGEAVDTIDNDGKPVPVISDSPKKFIVTEDGKLIKELEWEAPLFMDDRWPFEILSFRNRPGTVWAPSPLETGLGFQKALNWVYSLYISKARFTTRSLFAVAKINGQGLDAESLRQAIKGSPLEVLEIEVAGETTKLADYIQQLDFKLGIEEFQGLAEMLESAFERQTGLTALIAVGETGHQFRSAQEATLKDRNSRTRFDDMRSRVEDWSTKIARKEALMARFLMTADDIGNIFGPASAQVWGQLVPPMQVQGQALQKTAQMMGMTDPMEIDSYVTQNMQQGVVFEQWLLESDFSIEAGTTRRQDISQMQDASKDFMNQAFPALMQSGMIVPALSGMAAWAKLNNLPDEFIDAIKGAVQQAQMPPPMPMGPPGPPPGAPPGPPPPGPHGPPPHPAMHA